MHAANSYAYGNLNIPVSCTIFALSPLCASMINSSSLELSICFRVEDRYKINKRKRGHASVLI